MPWLAHSACDKRHVMNYVIIILGMARAPESNNVN